MNKKYGFKGTHQPPRTNGSRHALRVAFSFGVVSLFPDGTSAHAAIYITDRKVLFNMIEAAHYQLRQQTSQAITTSETSANPNRTVDLIDSFLDTIPPEEEEDEKQGKRAPTPADATIDYVAYLLQCEANEKAAQEEQTPQMKGQSLIDSFLEQEQGRIMLNDLPSDYSIEEEPAEEPEDNEEEYFRETLARIYIKQGRYQKAYDIIGRLSNKYPQKNAYFADQMRFLEKLIINSNKNKNLK